MASRRKKTRPAAKARAPLPTKPKPGQAAPAGAYGPDIVPLREAVRLHVAGQLEATIPFYRRALEIRRNPATLNNLGAALRDLKRSAEAAPFFREAVEREPDYIDGHLNLGLCLHDIGDLAGAERALTHALAGLPRPQDGGAPDQRLLQAVTASASILRTRQKFDDVIALYEQLAREAHKDANAQSLLGAIYYDLNRLPDAIKAYEAALALDPDFVVALGNLGTAYMTAGRTEDSVACQRKAIALDPENPKHLVNLGAALKGLGLLGEAADAYRRAIALKPDYDYAINNLGNMLRERGELHTALDCFRRALAISPDYLTAFSNLLFSLNSVPELTAEQIGEEHRRFGALVEAKAPPPTPHGNRAEPERRLRIGYLSPDFLGHSVAYFIENLLEHHDRKNVEIVCYAQNRRTDSLSRRLQARADLWRPCSHLSDQQLADLIRADGIDILVELAGHTAENRLAMMAHRPAPIQVTYLGYPNTTGLSRIDYRLIDALVDPPGESDRIHSEKLVRLPRSFLCYRPSDFAGEVAPRPVASAGHVTFGSFNALAKMTDTLIATWSRILAAVPNSRLLLKNNAFSDPSTAAFYRQRFAERGLDPARLELMGRQPMIGDHLAMYGRIDIALDPFPYNGTTTTCEALWMGVPLVALRGDRHVARVSAALLHNVGLDALAADDIEGYVRTAVALAQDPGRIQAISTALRPSMAASPIMDAAGFAREVDAAYRQMWRRYCRDHGAVATEAEAQVISVEDELADGTARFARGDYTGAERVFRHVAARDPSRPDAALNIGTVLKRQRRHDEALEYLQRAVALKPDWASAHANLASGYCDLGRLDEAEAACREAIRLDPNARNAYSNLASVHASRRQDAEAVACYRKALEIGPPSADIYVNLSAACISAGLLGEAVAAGQAALALQPDFAEAYANLAVARGAQGRPQDGIEAGREVVKLQPDLHLAWSNLVFSMNYSDAMSAEEVFREHRDWGRRVASLAAKEHANKAEPDRPLKIGFVSADFCAHSVAFFLKPLFDAHDPRQFAFICYSDVVNPDIYTDFLKARTAGWRATIGLSDSRVAEMIREDGIDILVDLAGHTSKNRLRVFALKPAPVQVSWLGYPNTTGLAAMDWRLVDPVTDPPGVADKLAVERLFRLAPPFLCYEPAPKTPDVEPSPALGSGYVTFGSFNKINKISDAAVALWARVLAAVPSSRLILKSLSFNDPATRERLLSIIVAAGVAPERVTLLSWEPLLKGHLATYHRIDIALDTIPYNGTTTTCEAAWMGVPTVALCGDRHAARVGATINQAIGLPQLVAADEAGFVKAASDLAADIPALAALRAGLRDRMRASPLCDGQGFARKFEGALRGIWQDWCGGRPQAQFGSEGPAADAAVDRHWRAHPALTVFPGTPATGRRLQIGVDRRIAGWETFNIQPGPEVDHLGDCQDLTRFPDAAFEAVYGSHVLAYVPLKDAVRTLKEWCRVLAPGGQVLISVPNIETIMGLFLAPERTAGEKLHLTRMIYGGQIDDFDYHCAGYFPALLERVLLDAGFAKVVQVKEFGLFSDTSSLRFAGELISLNVIAQKPN